MAQGDKGKRSRTAGKKRTTRKKRTASSRAGTRKKRTSRAGGKDATDGGTEGAGRLVSGLAEQLAGNALQFAARTTEVPLKMARALLIDPDKPKSFKPDQLEMMYETGQYIRDVREVAGLTVSELGEALQLKDKSVLEAAENGTAVLSFELILRLASLLARHDPLPFVIRLARTYNPDAWRVLENWGIGRLPLQLERERQFINIYRSRDEARKLSDDGFAEVLKFTKGAFDMALHFVAERENLPADDE